MNVYTRERVLCVFELNCPCWIHKSNQNKLLRTDIRAFSIISYDFNVARVIVRMAVCVNL